MASRSDLKLLPKPSAGIFLYLYPSVNGSEEGVLIGGGCDAGLSEEGKIEVLKFSKRFKRNPDLIRRMIASPELRAVQAADFIHDQLRVKFRIFPELSDQNLGQEEGLRLGPGEPSDPILPAPIGGETEGEFCLRVRRGLEKVLEEDGTVLLVVHFRVAQAILTWLSAPTLTLKHGILYCFNPVEKALSLIN